ncbi:MULTISPECIES: DEAD/DEAH box helicase [Halolamina]|uniref:Fanconi anemia group M protein n=1 Tax=Halolamina pelagica TaxID=699431 RepID=A0A1I5QCP3_9EURY|nr:MULTISPECIES: DEAD/DEAH box helicase [Halolamina]NHX35197.1 DEAD/DEAH box helicase [Halolamina sp. R1-12]SFP43877.1 fanconi anemia group M protein [Halolamina pelagica]
MAATDDVGRIDHPLLTPDFLERRLYQLQLAGTAQEADTLVCLPTGLGKTTVSLLVTAERLQEVGGKALMLAPTKPLVQQHAEFYREALQIPDEEIVVFTGEVSPDDRAELWESATVVIATPQVVENDLVGNRISLADVTHLTFDECHRATGDYAYVYIAERYHADAADPLVTGMSASPGGDEEEILQVCENLGLTEVEVMTEDDADVDEFTHDTDVQWERVDLPEEILDIRELLNEVITERLEDLKELGVTNATSPDLSQKKLNGMRAELQKLINNDQSEGYQGMSTHAEIMKLRRAVELVETQSVESVRRYFERQREDARSSGASKASQRMVSDPRVRRAMRKADTYDDLHPKFSKARILLAQTLGIGDGERVIVFTESRDTAEALTEFLGRSFETRKFVGQGDKEGSDGMTQKEQQERLDQFRNGEFEVLVSTSVAEEGLDVPEVDLVLFYEPVPTAIRSIQRKGRTGRQAEGKVVVLMANDTRDEAFFWIARRREQEMEDELRELKGVADEVEEELDDAQQSLSAFDSGDDGEAREERLSPGLDDFAEADGDGGSDDSAAAAESAGDADGGEEGVVATADSDPEEDVIEVVIDQRELDSPIAKELSRREGVRTRLETLDVGDYVLSDRVAVERKSVADFLDTLTGGDRSMFEQVGDLSRAYARPVVILEGEDLYGERNVHPNAIRGALSSLAIDFDASVLRTEDEDDTADLLEVVASREQEESDRTVSVHGEKSGKTLAEQQEYVVGSVADIGPVTARALLEEFKTVEAVMTARKEDLMAVDGIGEVTADRLREVVGSEYTGDGS